MPICTYLNQCETERPIQDKDVNEWLTRARESTGKRLVVHEHIVEIYRWFKKKTHWSYEIFWPIGDGIEHQCINFYRDGTDWSINTCVTKELAIAYLMGLCCSK